jgi:hypothetical protein
MQRLLRYARWDADAVRNDLRAYTAEHLGDDGGVLISRIPDDAVFTAKPRLAEQMIAAALEAASPPSG